MIPSANNTDDDKQIRTEPIGTSGFIFVDTYDEGVDEWLESLDEEDSK